MSLSFQKSIEPRFQDSPLFGWGPLCLILFLCCTHSGFAESNRDNFTVGGLQSETHLDVLEKAERFKKELEELLQVSIKWPKPVQIQIQQRKTETLIERNKQEIKRTIYFYPENTTKELELDREIVRLIFYDLLLISSEKITCGQLWIPLWLVEGISYNILEDRLVSPHFIMESRRMKTMIPIESLLNQSTFFNGVEKNLLFSFESASLVEYLLSIPFGESKLKKYLLYCQQGLSSPEALLKAFKPNIRSLSWLTKDWQAKAVKAYLESRAERLVLKK